MLSHLSWPSYSEIIFLLLVIYYPIIGARFYAHELGNLFNRLTAQSTVAGGLPAALQYQEPLSGTGHSVAPAENNADETAGDAGYLAGRLKACISIAADKPFAPAVLYHQLRKILQEHSQIGASPMRSVINDMIVNECEKTGTALLTEDEVDQWWSD